MQNNHPLKWRTRKIDKQCKYLLLGSFTSDGGADYYYYASSRNHFWYLLDTVLTCPDYSFGEEDGCKKIKDIIISKDSFAKLIMDLKNVPEEKRDSIREKIHKRLIEHSFDICDLFESVQVKDTKLNSDANIIIEKSKKNDLRTMLNGCNIDTIYCTSNYVSDVLKDKYPELGEKAITLTAPTTNNRIKLRTKIDDWRATIK